jgi:hypothetical protein
MAKDHLAIPASSTDSERVFSYAKLIGTDRRSQLSSSNFEALQILRSALSSGLLTLDGMTKLSAKHHFKNDWKKTA